MQKAVKIRVLVCVAFALSVSAGQSRAQEYFPELDQMPTVYDPLVSDTIVFVLLPVSDRPLFDDAVRYAFRYTQYTRRGYGARFSETKVGDLDLSFPDKYPDYSLSTALMNALQRVESFNSAGIPGSSIRFDPDPGLLAPRYRVAYGFSQRSYAHGIRGEF